MDLTDLMTAIGIMLLLEGGIIALVPGRWRAAVTQLLAQSEDSLRTFGLIFVLVGAAILWFAV